MEAKFTPGIWSQSHRKTRNGMYSTEVYSETGETIATLSWYKKPPQKKIIDGELRIITETYREANAKLIAASPFMFQKHIDNELLCDAAIQMLADGQLVDVGRVIAHIKENCIKSSLKATE